MFVNKYCNKDIVWSTQKCVVNKSYLYMRNALKEMIHMFQPLCDTLILVCHVKDKQIKKNEEETTEMAVDLAKLYWPAA